MRPFLVILAASVAAFLFWQVTRADPRVGEPTIEDQMDGVEEGMADTAPFRMALAANIPALSG